MPTAINHLNRTRLRTVSRDRSPTRVAGSRNAAPTGTAPDAATGTAPRWVPYVGAYLVALGCLLVAVLPWLYSVATDVTSTGAVATARGVEADYGSVEVLWFTLEPTPASAVLAVVAFTAMVGSLVVMALTFSMRAGHRTLDEGFFWWYLTRPLTAAGLALVLYLVVIGGFFDLTSVTEGSTSALATAAALGGLAGLFTDQILDLLRGALALLPFTTLSEGKSRDRTERLESGEGRRS